MFIKAHYDIKKITNSEAVNWIKVHHYIHTTFPCSHAFGMYEIATNSLVGVVCYGVPHSPTLRKGLCGEAEEYNVYELNRWWVDESVGDEGAVHLIKSTITELDREIVVSFVNTAYSQYVKPIHDAGFLYTGKTKPHKDPAVGTKGSCHHASYARGMAKDKFIEFYGKDNVTYGERSIKYRYVAFNATGTRLAELKAKLKYGVLPNPTI